MPTEQYKLQALFLQKSQLLSGRNAFYAQKPNLGQETDAHFSVSNRSVNTAIWHFLKREFPQRPSLA